MLKGLNELSKDNCDTLFTMSLLHYNVGP